MEKKLEAVAIMLPRTSRNHNHRLGIRAGSTDSYVSLYVDGKYAGDMRLEEQGGNPILKLFAPTGEPRYYDIDLHPTGYEWDRRHKDFEFHDFDWE